MSEYDPTDFVDSDFQTHKSPQATAASGLVASQRAPTAEEMDSRVVQNHQRLAELKRAQEQLERERAGLEETRRRQRELHTGCEELTQELTRGLGLLEDAEFNARLEAEQMSKTLAALREALNRIQSIHEETWTQETFNVELTRALTTIENARMEWNSARLKFPVLAGKEPAAAAAAPAGRPPDAAGFLAGRSFGQWCKIGLALTWPVALVALGALATLLVLLFR